MLRAEPRAEQRLEPGQLTGQQKAAALLIALGPDLSAQVLKGFSETEVERLAREIVRMDMVQEEVKHAVLEEVFETTLAQQYITQGGLDYARALLDKTLGESRADEVISRLAARARPQPFDFIRDTDPLQLSTFLQAEHPQTIALVLAHLEPAHAANVLALLPVELQGDVAMRLASMDRTAPEVVKELSNALKKKLWTVLNQGFSRVGGLEYLVKVLNKVDRGTEKGILEWLDEANQDLAENIRRQMFVFENLVMLDDVSLQRVLRETDQRDLALALKVTSEELKARVFANLSQRAAEGLKEDMQLLGPVRVKMVEEAQSRIVEIVRRLERAEEIVITRGGEDVFV